MKKLRSLDSNILLFIQDQIRHPFLDKWMKGLSSLADIGIISIVTCIFLLISLEYRRIGWIVSISLILEAILVNGVLKPLLKRKRPYLSVKQLTCIAKIPYDFSFPSGHTASCFAVAGVMFMSMPYKYGVPALILASFVAFSRIYLGVHYPSDVLGGIAIGLLAGYIAEKVLLYPVLEWLPKLTELVDDKRIM